MDGTTVLPIMEFYKESAMEAETEKTDLEQWSEEQHDLGDYPDGFEPSLYDL